MKFFAEKNNSSYLNNNRIRVSNKVNIDECLFPLIVMELKKFIQNLI